MPYTKLEVAVGSRPTLFGDDVIYLDLRDCGIRPFVQHDMTLPLPFEDGQFSHIQAMHCLEHVVYADTDRVLAQWAAKLAHRGILHIEVPDVAYQAQRILANPLDNEAIVMMYGTQVDMSEGMNQHRTAFTAALLERGLKRAGLENVWVRQEGGCLVAEGRKMVAGQYSKVSIVHVTKRLGGLDILLDSLQRQTLLPDLLAEQRIELIIVDEHAQDENRRNAVRRFHDQLPMPIKHIYPNDYPEPMYGKLSLANNHAVQAATGDLLFFVNDSMVMPNNTLERLLHTMDSLDHDALLTTICHHASVPTMDDVYDLNGPFSIFRTPFRSVDYDFPNVPVSWQDPRAQPEVEAESKNPFMWEANVALAKTDLIRKVGGFSTLFDEGIGADNVALAIDVMLTTPGTTVLTVKDVVVFSANHYVLQPNPKEQVLAEARNQRTLRRYLTERGVRMG